MLVSEMRTDAETFPATTELLMSTRSERDCFPSQTRRSSRRRIESGVREAAWGLDGWPGPWQLVQGKGTPRWYFQPPRL
jgi:hypothetical protein